MEKISPPAFSELNDYYKSYWKLLKDDDLLESVIIQGKKEAEWLATLSEEAENFAYAEGKWMLKEVIGHICDAERILCYRALRFSRNDRTPLEAFDENSYMEESNFSDRKLKDILEEWKSVRAATVTLFKSMSDQMLDYKGEANKVMVSPRIILFFILIHCRHHLRVVRERYLHEVISA